MVLSSLGGDIDLGLESVLALENINYPFRAKIYRAGSIAALAALMAPYREIVEHGEIWLHLGNTIEIESCDISADGKIPKKTFELLTLCRSKTLEKLKQVAPKLLEDGKMWSTFIAHNHLRLNAEQCLHYNLVHRIC